MEHLLILLATCIAASSGHIDTYKSFEDATRNCADYYQLDETCIQRFLASPELGKSIDARLTRCVLNDLVAWDDTTGIKESVLRQFFQPAGCCDRDYRHHTAQCVQQQLVNTAEDVNGRAYEAFRCYLRHYGTLIRLEKKFIPLAKESLIQLKIDDYLIANTPQCALVEFSRGDFGREDEAAKLLFTGAIRGGFLDETDKRKISLDKLYTQFGNPELIDPKTIRCVDNVAREYGPSGNIVQSLFQQLQRCCIQFTTIYEALQEAAGKLVANANTTITASSVSNRINSCGCKPEPRYYYPSQIY